VILPLKRKHLDNFDDNDKKPRCMIRLCCSLMGPPHGNFFISRMPILKVKFKNPHRGIGGPNIPLSNKILSYMRCIVDYRSDMDLGEFIRMIDLLSPDDHWVSVDYKNGWVKLLYHPSHPGGSDSKWKLIEFEETKK